MKEKLSERIARDGITADADMIGSAEYGRYEWSVTLHRPDGRAMKLHDYSGPEEPSALDALGSLLIVATRVDTTEGYEGWASEFELDPADWQDRETYELQCRETGKLRIFLGGDFDAYLYETEKDD